MSIEAGIIAYLESHVSVTNITDVGAASRIRGGFLQEGDIQAGPSIVVTSAGNVPTYSMNGAEGISSVTLNLDCLASEYGDANSLAAAVVNVTSGFAKRPAGHSFVEACFVSNVIDTPPDVLPEIQELNVFGRRVEIFLWVRESIPTLV